MSYTEFLNRKKINSPTIIDTRMKMGDASSFTWRTKMATNTVSNPSDHVINNTNDPSVTPNFYSKKPGSTSAKFGGKVMDASMYTLGLGSTSIGRDNFTGGKIIKGGGSGNACLTRPPASQIVNQSGNADNSKLALNMIHINTVTCPFTPLTKSYFVDTIPEIKTHKVGVSAVSGSSKGVQLPISCKDTNTNGPSMNTDGSLVSKDEKTLNLYSKGPTKTDFVTGVLGPQVSSNGSGARAPKVGGALSRPKYSEKHHGRAWGPKPYPSAFVPPTGAPAQLKINSPLHYPVA